MKNWIVIQLIVFSIFLPMQGQSKTVSESERQILLSYDVDVIVVGVLYEVSQLQELPLSKGPKSFL